MRSMPNCTWMMLRPLGTTAVPAAPPCAKLVQGTSIFVQVVGTSKMKVGWAHALPVPVQVPIASPALAGVDGSDSCIERVRVDLPVGALPFTQNERPWNAVAFKHPLNQVPEPPP